MKESKFTSDFFKSTFYLVAISFVFISGLLIIPESTHRDTNIIVDYLVRTADIPNQLLQSS